MFPPQHTLALGTGAGYLGHLGSQLRLLWYPGFIPQLLVVLSSHGSQLGPLWL